MPRFTPAAFPRLSSRMRPQSDTNSDTNGDALERTWVNTAAPYPWAYQRIAEIPERPRTGGHEFQIRRSWVQVLVPLSVESGVSMPNKRAPVVFVTPGLRAF